jgi:hypothetical protein
MRAAIAIHLLALLAGCKSGEHQTVVGVCDAGGDAARRLAPSAVEQLDAELRQRLTAAHLRPCTWKRPRSFQLGARPAAWYCGTIGDTDVEASINRPGQRGCELELDLRADVSGTESSIHRREAPIIAFGDAVADSWEKQLTERGLSIAIRRSGARLGE